MSSAEAFPFHYPPDARRAFESDEITRRFALIAGLASGSRVMEILPGRGTASLLLAKEFGCDVTCVEADDAAVAALTDRVRSMGLADRISIKRSDPAKPDGPAGSFDAIVVQGRVVGPLEACVRQYRTLLSTNGRLMITYPARVGRFPQKQAVEFWEKRLGESMRYPREILQTLEVNGYEPEAVETLDDTALAELYRGVESKADGSPKLREEVDVFRGASNKASVTYAFAIGRRKEPGEKPPTSRDRG
jgi:cyclopropane fatty-acyl-phospholipid synthase-like methyltransferase